MKKITKEDIKITIKTVLFIGLLSLLVGSFLKAFARAVIHSYLQNPGM